MRAVVFSIFSSPGVYAWGKENRINHRPFRSLRLEKAS